MRENMEEGLKLFNYTKLEDISTEDKVKAFDRLYKMCLAHAAGHFGVDDMFCHTECDCEAYIAQEAMVKCLGQDTYTQLNAHEGYRFC
jgi:hypothetical protein